MKNLQEDIKNKKPIKVYLENNFFDTFYYNKENNNYQGKFGYMPVGTITKVLLNKEETNHIKIEGVENEI